MKSQLLILGNGFDLQCGLKSNYEVFFRQEILDVIGEKYGFINTRIDAVGFWEELLAEYYKNYRQTEYPWYVVESIIKDTLWEIFGDENCIADQALNLALNNTEPKFPKGNDAIYSFLMKYCFNFFLQLPQRVKHRADERTLNLLMEKLLQELHNFERRFCKYIKDNIVNPQNEKELNETYIVNALNLLARLTGFSTKNYTHISDIFDERKTLITTSGEPRYENGLACEFNNLKSTYILSFNYTALFDLLKIKSPCRAYSNVHGKLCNKACLENCDYSNIIFGIDDKFIQSQDEYKDLRIFSKTYRKMFDTSEPESVLPPSDNPVDIKFYGHSLSEADYSYFQSIFDYYNLYGNSKVSLYFYYSEKYDPTDAVYRLLNEYGRTLTNQDQGKNLIHKLLLENRIHISKID